MFGYILTCLKAKMGDAKGVTIIEYALMLVLIALAVALLTPGVREAVEAVFDQVVTELALPV